MKDDLRSWPLASLLLLVALFAGCAGSPDEGEWLAEREERGDTLVVRTVAGSVWGDTMVLVPELSIGVLEGDEPYVFGAVRSVDVDGEGNVYAVEGQARQVRVFSPEGEHLRSFGRSGDGPGEFRSPDQLRVLSDGRIVVRDRAGRFSVFSADGSYLAGWPIGSGYMTTEPFALDSEEYVVNPSRPDAYVRYALDGSPRDTLPVPTLGVERQMVEMPSAGGPRMMIIVPFAPQEHAASTADGGFLFGTGDGYWFERYRPDGSVLRLERVAEPVPVGSGEAAQYGGTQLPSVKTAYKDLIAGRDDTMWLVRNTVAEEEPNPFWDSDRPESGSPTRWREPVVADVFDEDGRYLGAVRLPDRMDLRGAVYTRDRVWAMAEHETGYPQVVRFRLEPEGPE